MEFYDTSQLPANLAKRSYALALLRINPNGKAPILAMSGLAKEKMCNGIGHSYWTKTGEYTSLQLTVAIASDATTTFTAAAGDVAKLVPNMVLRYQDPTDPDTKLEHVLITSIDTATTFTVVRGFGGTTAQAAIAITDTLAEVGVAFEQGSAAPQPRSIGFQIHTNFTQIFRHAYGNAKTLTASQVEVGDGNLAENRRDCMWFHAVAIELAILFGTKSPANLGDAAPTYNSRPITTMDGIENSIRSFAPTNILSAQATTTFAQLEAMVDPTLDYQTNMSDSNDRVIYCGKVALKVFNNLGKLDGQNMTTPQETIFGQRFREFQTTRGNFKLVEHPLLNTTPDRSRMAFVMDFSAFNLRWLRKTTTEEIKGAGRDEDAGVMTSELTLEFMNPFACAVIHNLTAAA